MACDVYILRNLCLLQGHKKLSVMFPSDSFIDLLLTFRSVSISDKYVHRTKGKYARNEWQNKVSQQRSGSYKKGQMEIFKTENCHKLM